MFAIPQSDSHESNVALGEISAILAAGLQRLFDRKSSQKLPGVAETPLDCRALSGGHVRKRTQDMTP
jgi:hypothetical protein